MVSHITSPLWGESASHLWIPLAKASNADLWCLFCCQSEQVFEQQATCHWFEMPWYSCDVTVMFFVFHQKSANAQQSGTKPKLVAKILATTLVLHQTDWTDLICPMVFTSTSSMACLLCKWVGRDCILNIHMFGIVTSLCPSEAIWHYGTLST